MTTATQSPPIPRLTLAHMFPLLLILFITSTAATTILFLTWFQPLHQSLSSDSISLPLFLTTLATALSLGALLSLRTLNRFHPLRLWSFLQFLFALLAFLLIALLPRFDVHSSLLRVIVHTLPIFLPALLAGASLPLAFKTATLTRTSTSSLLTTLTAGVTLGTLYAAFLFLRHLDLDTTAYFAAAAILATAALTAALPAPASTVAPSTFTSSSPTLLLSLALTALTLAAAPTLWTRLLSMLLGDTPYTFALLLAITFAGITLGHGIATLFLRSNAFTSLLPLVWCQLLTSVALAWSAAMVSQNLPHWPVANYLAIAPRFTFQLDLARTLFALLPTTFLLGATFACHRASMQSAPSSRALAANSLGAILGAPLITLLFAITTPQFTQRLLLLLPALASLLTLANAYSSCAPTSPPRPALHATLLSALLLPLLCLFTLHHYQLDFIPPGILSP